MAFLWLHSIQTEFFSRKQHLEVRVIHGFWFLDFDLTVIWQKLRYWLKDSQFGTLSKFFPPRQP